MISTSDTCWFGIVSGRIAPNELMSKKHCNGRLCTNYDIISLEFHLASSYAICLFKVQCEHCTCNYLIPPDRFEDVILIEISRTFVSTPSRHTNAHVSKPRNGSPVRLLYESWNCALTGSSVQTPSQIPLWNSSEMTTHLVLHLGYPTAKLGKHVELEKDPIITHAFARLQKLTIGDIIIWLQITIDRSFRENLNLHSFTVSHQCKQTARSTDTSISLVMTVYSIISQR